MQLLPRATYMRGSREVLRATMPTPLYCFCIAYIEENLCRTRFFSEIFGFLENIVYICYSDNSTWGAV